MIKLKYPKFTILLIIYLATYLVFFYPALPLHDWIISLGYLGAFVAGALYTYGFTSGPAAAVFIVLADNSYNLLVIGLIGGVGVLLGKLIMFKFARFDFKDEIVLLSREDFFVYVVKGIPRALKQYLALLLGGLIISSPLPDEIGVFLIAAASTINAKFSILSYFFNTAGIFVLLLIGVLV